MLLKKTQFISRYLSVVCLFWNHFFKFKVVYMYVGRNADLVNLFATWNNLTRKENLSVIYMSCIVFNLPFCRIIHLAIATLIFFFLCTQSDFNFTEAYLPYTSNDTISFLWKCDRINSSMCVTLTCNFYLLNFQFNVFVFLSAILKATVSRLLLWQAIC